jgi:hypothetical protein
MNSMRYQSTRKDLSTWLTKIQAAGELGVGTKTVDRLAENGDLQRELRPRVGMAPVAVFRPEDIKREKARRAGTTYVPVGQESNLTATHDSKMALPPDSAALERSRKLLRADSTLTFGASIVIVDWLREIAQSAGVTLDQAIRDLVISVYLDRRKDYLLTQLQMLQDDAACFRNRPAEEPGEESKTAKQTSLGPVVLNPDNRLPP